MSDARQGILLTNVGLDILFEIMSYVGPCDLLALRMTCNLLRDTTMHRTVWLSALRGVMHVHGISEGTYPLASMSLAMLEHRSLSPDKFASAMARGAGKDTTPALVPRSARILPPGLTEHEKKVAQITDPDKILNYVLAPGGRYLATVSGWTKEPEKRKTLITVWDLGLTGDSEIRVVSKELEKDVLMTTLNELFALPDDPDGALCLIFNRLTPRKVPRGTLLVVILSARRITLGSTAPILAPTPMADVLLPSLTVPQFTLLSPERRKLAVLVKGWTPIQKILVWDFINSRAALWNLPITLPVDKHLIASFNEIAVVTVTRAQALVYEIPHLDPASWRSPVKIMPDYRCVVRFEHALIHERQPQFYCYPFPTSPSLPSRFFWLSNGRHSVVYEVKTPDPDPDEGHFLSAPSYISRCRGPWDESNAQQRRYFSNIITQCGDSVCHPSVTLGAEHTVVNVRMLAHPERGLSSRFLDERIIDRVLSRPDSLFPMSMPQLCAATGRLCFLTSLADDRNNRKLHILDYLEAPV